MQNNAVIKSYVWHCGKCYFVSTIERDSSAPIIPSPRYFETIVWEYDWKTAQRGDMIHIESARLGEIGIHQEIVKIIFKHGPKALPPNWKTTSPAPIPSLQSESPETQKPSP